MFNTLHQYQPDWLIGGLLMRMVYLVLFLTFISSVAIAYHNKRPQTNNMPVSSAANTDANTSVAESSRGKMLYNNHCVECHESNVYIREKRRVKSTADIVYWISHWSNHLELDWNTDDINEVGHYLEETYYNFKAKPDK
jgi:hypothetical protein